MSAVLLLWLASQPAEPTEIVPTEIVPAELAPTEIVPTEFSEGRADLILLDDVSRANRWFLQGHLGTGFFDARREEFVARVVGQVVGGRRFGVWGVYGSFEWDSTFDFTLDIDRLDLVNLGVGLEVLNFLGHVRSSFTVGTTILASDTVIDEAGEAGWFFDLRPGALRWALSKEDWVIEFAPIGLDVMVPVTQGIPLVVWSYTTTVGVEWSIP